MNAPRVLLAGGGSGGHISPGLALSEAFQRRSPPLPCAFACSNRAIDTEMLQHAGAHAIPLPARPPTLRPAGFVSFLHGFRQSESALDNVIRMHDIERVVLLGGFVAAPAVRAARRRGIPSLLVNLDRVPGKANRWMRSRATRVVSAVTTTQPFADTVTGMPIREAASPPGNQKHCRELLGLPTDCRVLLVTGASQGAGSINKLIPHFAGKHPNLLDGWHILHLAGPEARHDVEADWKANGKDNVTVFGFTHEMGPLWGAADLVISRAGACSVAEIESAALPAVYIPYPHHKDQHQHHNATPAVEETAARIVQDSSDPQRTSELLADAVRDLLTDSSALASMRSAAEGRRTTNAADAIVDLALTMPTS